MFMPKVDVTSLYILVENIHPFRYVRRQCCSTKEEAEARSKASGVGRGGQEPRLSGGTRVQWVNFCSSGTFLLTFYPDIWYNKWAGGDREDALARCVYHQATFLRS